ncbi:ABC transporter substrate-binding protein [Lacticaseibacillus jixianensis]|uniref:ABC transporter substrate-binding protein n=1 Tax=Lacticaseibacillus jixianensis TaxID=2486012 RepID=A0ABW4B7F4_9LACO|nr:extracellular solute-binding protein [Lacticaseibacillus jixianensis]
MKKGIAWSLTLGTIALTLAACGNQSSTAKPAKDDGKEMTVTVYDENANTAGIAKGWFAKYVQDKFHMKLKMVSPNVSGGGNTLFDTRTAAGNLGDLIITSDTHAKKLVRAGLISDMTPYMSGMKYLKKYHASSDVIRESVGKKGVWGFNNNVSSQKPTEASEGLEPSTAAPYIRWDLYREIGYPKIKNTDELVTVLKKMQDQARKDTGDKNIWGVSLFKDWDSSNMQNAAQNMSFHGWEATQGMVLSRGNGKAYQSIIGTNSQYIQGARFLNKCRQAGILDPDSSAQTWTQIDTKVRAGKVLFSWWNFLGISGYNTTAHVNQGKGFALAPIQDMKITSNGASPSGATTMIAVGSKAKNKARLVKFINWLYSPQGVQINQAGNIATAGIKGLMWKMQAGKPVLTAFGDKVLNVDSNTKMPAKYGSTPFQSGISALNFPAVLPFDTDPTTGQAYNYNMWPSQMKASQSKLSKDWSAHMDGAQSSMAYLKKNHQLSVLAGVSYTAPEDDSLIATKRGTLNREIVSDSWKMVMANNDKGFDEELTHLQKTAKGLGYADVYKADLKQAKIKNAKRQAVIKQYAN